jgi:FkbM family methyltransferase
MFILEYTKAIAMCFGKEVYSNYDPIRFGKKPKRSANDLIFSVFVFLASRLGLTTIRYTQNDVFKGVSFISPHLSELEWLYSCLADEQSKDILVRVMAYRAMGYKKVKLPLNNPQHWENLRIVEGLVVDDEEMPTGFMHFNLSKMDLSKIGYPIQMYYVPIGIVIDFMEQQYRCETDNGIIECKPGDHVIDGGGCWGDTALYFAHHIGPNGKVYSFEFLPENLKILNRNLELNPELQKSIDLIPNPLWCKAGEDVEIRPNGPGTRIESGQVKKKAKDNIYITESIDHLVATGRIEKLDYVKMDIEGAELAALRGAEQSICRFKPDLAITVYHSLEDFWKIPQYLDSLNLGYKFYLRHFTIHAEETVLFASAHVLKTSAPL